MRQVFQNLQSLFDDVVALATFNIRHEAHPAGIVLMLRIVKALRDWDVNALRCGLVD